MAKSIEALETIPKPVALVSVFDLAETAYGEGIEKSDPNSDIACGDCKTVLMAGWSVAGVKQVLPSRGPVILRCPAKRCRAYNILPVTIIEP